jgi:FAD/FMN-containing dehydrogenase
MSTSLAWGRLPGEAQTLLHLRDRFAPLPSTEGSILAYGNGRSYGDVCLNPGGVLLGTRGLDRFIAFDTRSGRLRCESGVRLADILNLVLPMGWCLPVSPGTGYVTVGGAIANDVHGKNHHQAGSFGCHVHSFELLRSDGTRRECTREHSADWFAATIGGLGLTGLITWAELQLKPVANPWLQTESLRFDSLEAFFQLTAESDTSHEYTVAWLDCSPRARMPGRGIFSRACHAAADIQDGPSATTGRWSLPATPPVSLVNRLSLRAFNEYYFHRHGVGRQHGLSHYCDFMYPLDGIRNWNRVYGPRGFYQYQCVVPLDKGRETIRQVLDHISRSGAGSFLAVLKRLGSIPSPGLLSFPRAGVTLAVDFPNHGNDTLALLSRLDDVVMAAGGAVYPAKDARMSSKTFKQSFPHWQSFLPYVDPRFSSAFWRRVMETSVNA